MIKVITAKEINPSQLTQELGMRGLCFDFNDKDNKLIIPAEGSQITQEELELAVKNHIAVFKEPTIDEKLQSVGLSLDELKSALGI